MDSFKTGALLSEWLFAALRTLFANPFGRPFRVDLFGEAVGQHQKKVDGAVAPVLKTLWVLTHGSLTWGFGIVTKL